MFRQGVRFFSSGRLLLQTQATEALKPHVTLASKQFLSKDADSRQKRVMRRKEKRLRKQIIRDVNSLKQHDLKNVPYNVDPVLGDPECDFIKRIFQEVNNPESHLAYGIDRVEFEKLLYGAERSTVEFRAARGADVEATRERELKKKNALLTILNLRNTSMKDKQKYAIQLAREEFQRAPGDTASAEVKAAILTVKIHFKMQHVKNNKKDAESLQSVREDVQARQRHLKYLKKTDPEKYFYVLYKLGLTDDAVMREFSMSYQYLEDYKVWGDKVLVKVSDNQLKKQEKVNELRKRVTTYQELAKKNFSILLREATSN